MGTTVVKTDVGTFTIHVKEDVETDPLTRIATRIRIAITIGGRKDKCVYITAPDRGNTAKLHNVRVRGLICDMEGSSVRGERTVAMINLAFTIVKKEAPHIKYIDLDDNSDFPCELNDGTGRVIGISIALYELAFHQATWYEHHFGAILKNPDLQALYKKDGFFKPKPASYDFKHSVLNDVLGTVYAKTTTWKEFFDELYKKEDKCKLLIPWYRDALKMIMGANISFDGHDWCIDLANPHIKNISYTVITTSGGGRKSRRKFRRNDYLYDYIEDVSLINYL